MKQKLQSLQIGRGLAALIVLLFHAQLIARRLNPSSPWGYVFRFGASGVDFFFVLSGFLMMYVHRRDFSKPSTIGSYLYKRFTRIYPVYWILCIFLIPLILKIPALVKNVGKINAEVIATSFLLIPHGGPRIIGVTWTLEYEIFFYLVFALFLLSARAATGIFAIWFTAIAAMAVLGPSALSETGVPESYLPFFVRFAFSLHAAEFICGVFVAYLIQRGLRMNQPLWLLGFALLLGIGTAIYSAHFLETTRSTIVGFGLSAVLIVTASVLCELRYKLHPPSWLSLLGAASYPIYLTHFPAIFGLIFLVRYLHFLTKVPVPIAMFGGAVIALIPGFLMHFLVEQPLLAFFAQSRRTSAQNPAAESTAEVVRS